MNLTSLITQHKKLNEKMKKHKKLKKCGTFAWLHKKIPAVVHRSVSTQTTGVTFRLAYQKQSKKPFQKNFRKRITLSGKQMVTTRFQH